MFSCQVDIWFGWGWDKNKWAVYTICLTMEEYRRKHKLRQKHLRYLEQAEERRTQARQQVSQSHHIFLGTLGQSSSILGQKIRQTYREQALAHCTLEIVCTREGTFNFWSQEVTELRKSPSAAMCLMDELVLALYFAGLKGFFSTLHCVPTKGFRGFWYYPFFLQANKKIIHSKCLLFKHRALKIHLKCNNISPSPND